MPTFKQKNKVGKKREFTTRTSKDQRKLLVVSYLISLEGKRSTRHGIREKGFAGRSKQEPGDFKQLMNELMAMKWVDSETREDENEWYTFTENGRTALNEAKKLSRENHPLAALDIFEDILDF